MISLSHDYDKLYSSISELKTSEYLKNTIKMYLDAYNVGHGFAEFFLQTYNGVSVSSVILRYNSFIYCALSDMSDFAELSSWLQGFEGVTVYSNFELSLQSDEIVYEVHRVGDDAINTEPHILSSSEIMLASELINRDCSKEIITEFFLDLSHLVRHEKLKVYGIFEKNELVCVCACSMDKTSVIPFLFTDEYFRGNGYASRMLHDICSDNKKYTLICNEQNLGFYSRCGFLTVNKFYKYSL